MNINILNRFEPFDVNFDDHMQALREHKEPEIVKKEIKEEAREINGFDYTEAPSENAPFKIFVDYESGKTTEDFKNQYEGNWATEEHKLAYDFFERNIENQIKESFHMGTPVYNCRSTVNMDLFEDSTKALEDHLTFKNSAKEIKWCDSY